MLITSRVACMVWRRESSSVLEYDGFLVSAVPRICKNRLCAAVSAQGNADEGEANPGATVEATGLISEGPAGALDDIGPAPGVHTAVYWPKKPDGCE